MYTYIIRNTPHITDYILCTVCNTPHITHTPHISAYFRMFPYISAYYAQHWALVIENRAFSCEHYRHTNTTLKTL